jgi:sec-independent protein translocase protein TatA
MFRNPLIDAAVVLIVVLLIFGPKRLPELGKGLGKGMREFKDGITGSHKDEESEQPSLGAAAPPVNTPVTNTAEQTPSQNRGSAEVGSERHS